MAEFDQLEKKQEKILLKKTKLLQTRSKRKISFNAALLGVYGWHLSLPVLLGVILGRFLDHHIPLPPLSWTLNCILVGFMAGLYNANRWLKNEGIIQNMKRRRFEKQNRLTKFKRK